MKNIEEQSLKEYFENGAVIEDIDDQSLDLYLQNGVIIEDVIDKTNGNTALHHAVLENNIEMIHYLVGAGVEKDLQNNDGNTALHLAVSEDKLDIIKILTQAGANLYIYNNDGRIPLHLAIIHSQLEVVEYFVAAGIDINYRNDVGNSALHLAGMNQSENMLRYLISKNVYLEAPNHLKYTALHVAAANNNEIAVEILIAAGANIDATNITNTTILHMAAEQNNVEIAALAIKYGCNKEAKNQDGNTALHLAVSNGNIEIADLLIKEHANKEAKNYKEQTPLHLAVYNVHMNMIKKLLLLGVDKNSRDNLKHTALHIAGYIGNKEMVQLFLDKTNQDSKNFEGNTALQIAILNNHTEIALMLIEYGVNIENESKIGHTALITSIILGNIEVVTKLISKGVLIGDYIINAIIYSFNVAEFENTTKIIQAVRGAILADRLYYVGSEDIKEMLDNFDIDVFLSRLIYLYNAEGILNNLNLEILPHDLQNRIKDSTKSIKVSEEKIIEAVEVPLAEIFNKLYPEDFPCQAPYTLLLKYKDSDTKYNYQQNLNSYKYIPHSHPVQFFYYMTNPCNREKIITLCITMPEEMRLIIYGLKPLSLYYDQKHELFKLDKILNSKPIQAQIIKNLYYESKIMNDKTKDYENIIVELKDSIAQLVARVNKQQEVINLWEEGIEAKGKTGSDTMLVKPQTNDSKEALPDIGKRKFSESFVEAENIKRKDKAQKIETIYH
ncbi:Ankyrin repeat protein [Rickettsiales bacterium Ac37b]|nr:Ankyrin repeat protein [Rickettsiales bacterium Ac37b]